MSAFQGSSNGRVAKHGTHSGYVTHQKNGIPHEVCGDRCRKAHNKYTTARRKVQREEARRQREEEEAA